jgi:hypothetical protein
MEIILLYFQPPLGYQLNKWTILNWLRVGRSGNQIPLGGFTFRIRPDRLWRPIIQWVKTIFFGGKTAEAWR